MFQNSTKSIKYSNSKLVDETKFKKLRLHWLSGKVMRN